MSEVFVKRITHDALLKNPQVIVEGIKKSDLAKDFKKDAFLALKIHFGEKHNTSYINPNFLVPTVQFLKKTGVKPFLFETNTLYRGERMNSIDHMNLAYGHGFAKLNLPIIIGDGIAGADDLEVIIGKKHFSRCFLASALKDINAMLVLSHFTGHMLTGFGASIKNLGMGCASRRGKLAQHCDVNPQIIEQRCIGCSLCFRNCPVQAIEKRAAKCFIIKDKCIGCAQCVSVCPHGAADVVWSSEYNRIGEKMAEYALAVAKTKQCLYITFCIYVTKECDCMNKEKGGFVKDVGVLFSRDPVSIDKACIDLILKNENRDVLKEIHPSVDYLHHLAYAESIGLGSLGYTLIEL